MSGRRARVTHGLHPAQLGVDTGFGRSVAVEPRRDLDDAAVVAPEHLGEREELVGRRERPGHVAPVGDAVAQRPRRRPSERAGGQRLVEQRRHALELVAARHRSFVEASLAHRVVPERGVTHHAAHVHPERRAPEPGEVLAVRLPVPRQTVEDAPSRDVLDRLHHLGDVGVVARSCTGAKVTPQLPMTTDVTPCQHDDDPIGSHANCASRCVCTSTKPGVTRRPSASISCVPLVVHGTDVDDAVAIDRDVRAARRRARPVDDRATPDHQVVSHGPSTYGPVGLLATI